MKAILLDIADKNELVLKFPKAIVAFSDFGDSALVFQLYVYLASISNGLTVRSELRFAILKRLREAGIEIPTRSATSPSATGRRPASRFRNWRADRGGAKNG